ncbi:hypothetical protein G3A43_08625 [Paraburkholderia aspalathi]|nr:hypothetical protein [Paraburkholderia aspalathi]MBK3780321.1 hypothetical protein [Paraburkholderia aspalathi]
MAPTLTTRGALKAVSPIAADALAKVEARRHIHFSDAEIEAELHSAEYRKAYESALHEFCGKPENAQVLACLPSGPFPPPVHS